MRKTDGREKGGLETGNEAIELYFKLDGVKIFDQGGLGKMRKSLPGSLRLLDELRRGTEKSLRAVLRERRRWRGAPNEPGWRREKAPSLRAFWLPGRPPRREGGSGERGRGERGEGGKGGDVQHGGNRAEKDKEWEEGRSKKKEGNRTDGVMEDRHPDR